MFAASGMSADGSEWRGLPAHVPASRSRCALRNRTPATPSSGWKPEPRVAAPPPALYPVAPIPTLAGPHLDPIINQAILFLLLALGGVGVCVALPRRGLNPQPIGAILAGAAAGLIVLVMSVKARPFLPNVYFYV